MASSINNGTPATSIPGICSVTLAEIIVPRKFTGRSIGDLNIRKRYDITILMVKRKEGKREGLSETVPEADTVLEVGDVVVAMGMETDLVGLNAANDLLNIDDSIIDFSSASKFYQDVCGLNWIIVI